MNPVEVPDLSKWVENLKMRIQVEDKGTPVGFAKFFLRLDRNNPDKRVRKLIQQCMIFYAFNVEVIVKEWIIYADDGNGSLQKILYSAILMDRINNKWAIGLPNQNWVPKISYDGKEVIGMTVSVPTADGMKSVYVKNPHYNKK